MLRKRKLGGGAEVPALQAPLSTLPRHRPKRAAELVVANWTLLFFVLLTAAGLLPAAGARQGGRPAAAAATEAAAAAAALPRRRLAALAPKTPNISAVPADLPLHWISLPQGFRIEVYANASFPVRFLSVGNRGSRTPAMITYASTLIGYVMALVDRGGGAPVEACAVLTGLDKPNGIAYDASTGSLFVAEHRAISRWGGVDASALAGCDPALLDGPHGVAGPELLPDAALHGVRHLALGPADGKLYVHVGAPFNFGNCTDPYCTILRLDPDGGDPEVFARGVRNSAAFTFHHPGTGLLVFSGMERDQMGDDIPDDLLGMADPQAPGADFRWPYCHWEGAGPPELRLPGTGAAIADPNMTLPELVADGEARPPDAEIAARCAEVTPPALQALGPHVAPLGLAYWPAPGGGGISAGVQRWPARYDGSFFNAQHGSWNREEPIGYRVMNVAVNATPGGGLASRRYSLFASGWLRPDGTSWGRPTGLARLPDGSLLLGDNRANCVYRIWYRPPSPPPRPPRPPKPPPPSPRPPRPPPSPRPPRPPPPSPTPPRPPPSPTPLMPGVYTLQLVGRSACAIRGNARARQACGGGVASNITLSTSTTPTSLAFQRWIISIAAGSPGTGGIVGPSVSLRSAGRATTGCTTSYAAAAACGVSPTARLTAAAGASALWKLEAGPGGTFHILSLARTGCSQQYLGISSTCSVAVLGLYAKGGSVAVQWRLAKVP